MFRSLLRLARGSRGLLWLTLSVPATLLFTARPALSQYTGYWHTSGSQILDSSGKAVRISGVNWYGFETTNGVVHGLASQDYHTILTTIHALGYNTVRLPFANQIVESPIIPGDIAYSNSSGAINTDLKGLNSLQIMDKLMTEAGFLGLKVILDNHRSESGNSAEANGLWYTVAYPENNWIADWKTLATRYRSYKDANGNPTVIGVDLRNEPHNATSGGSCWTGDSSVSGCATSSTAQNWPAAAGRAGNAVLAINPSLLIFVEGTDCYNGDCDFWGGNLEGAKNYPVQLSIAQRLVYSAHDYGPTEYQQSWFNSSTSAQSLTAVWTKFWAYLSISGVAPVWVGEFGTTNDAASAESGIPGSEGQWFSGLVAFLANEPAISWTYWALNGEDNYGLLDSNYDATPPSSLKQQLLSSIQAPPTMAAVCGALPAVPTKLAAAASSSSAIGLTWAAVTPAANCAVTYSVFRGTASTFTPTTATQIVSGLRAASYTNTGLSPSTTYYYSVESIDAKGASSATANVSASTPAAPVCGASPATPGGVTALPTSSSAVSVSWTAVAAPANCSISYSVFRSTTRGFTPASGNQIASGLVTPAYGDNGLSAATTYYYAVQASDGKGTSPVSAQASATTALAAPAVACHVAYGVQSQWANGFQVALTIANSGSTSISNWTLKFAFPGNQQVTSLWNANYTQSGKTLTLTNESYNGTIQAGASYDAVGFTGSYSGVNSAPATFTLNGTVCH